MVAIDTEKSKDYVQSLHTHFVCTNERDERSESQMMILEVAAEVKCANMQPTSRQ